MFSLHDDRDPEGGGREQEPFEDPLVPELQVSLLGHLEVVVGGRDLSPTAPRPLQLLALLLLRAGRVVPTDEITEELWGDRPPRSARSAVQTHIYQLRRCIAAVGGCEPEQVVVRRPTGYRLLVDPRRIDLTWFRTWYQEGRAHLARDRTAEAATALRAADGLWSGPPMADVAYGSVLAAEAVELLEERRAARDLRIEAEIDEGRHRELVGELSALTAVNPLDETVHAHLIRVLGRCGRRADAMSVFRRLRDVLAVELGVEPDDEVHEAYRELLTLGDLRAAA